MISRLHGSHITEALLTLIQNPERKRLWELPVYKGNIQDTIEIISAWNIPGNQGKACNDL